MINSFLFQAADTVLKVFHIEHSLGEVCLPPGGREQSSSDKSDFYLFIFRRSFLRMPPRN